MKQTLAQCFAICVLYCSTAMSDVIITDKRFHPGEALQNYRFINLEEFLAVIDDRNLELNSRLLGKRRIWIDQETLVATVRYSLTSCFKGKLFANGKNFRFEWVDGKVENFRVVNVGPRHFMVPYDAETRKQRDLIDIFWGFDFTNELPCLNLTS